MRTRRVAVFALWLQREEARLIKRVIVSILYHLVWAFSHAAEEWHCLGSAYGVIQCAVFFSATVRRNIRRQQSLINISSLFVHMGLGTTFQIKMGAYTHSYTHTNTQKIQMPVKNSTAVSHLPPHSPVNGKANQISAANQIFISRAIWPSANCVSFKSLSVSSATPPPFSLKNVCLWACLLAPRGGLRGVGGVVCWPLFLLITLY